MKIIILSVGKPKDRQISFLVDQYLKRLKFFISVSLEYVPESKDPLPSRKVEKEGNGILKSIRERDFLVTLEERGKLFESIAFSEWIASTIEQTEGRIVFILGGAFGLSDEVRRRRDFSLSLSPMTMPHELCFVFLLEQIYRGFTLIRGIDYHH